MPSQPLPQLPDHVFRIKANINGDPNGLIDFTFVSEQYPGTAWHPTPSPRLAEDVRFSPGRNGMAFTGITSGTTSGATMTVTITDVQVSPERVYLDKTVALDDAARTVVYLFKI